MVDDPRKLYRREHHDTEREAAEAIFPYLNRIQVRVLTCARTFPLPGFTHRDLQERMGDETHSTMRTRVSELVDKGYIIKTRAIRQYPPSKRNHIVWQAIPEGERPAKLPPDSRQMDFWK